jgi:hypothetical protein
MMRLVTNPALLLYLIGSICFLVGTIFMIVSEL